MTTVATNPTYAVANRESQVVFTLTESTANYVRVWVTIAPEGSELDGKLKESNQNRFVVFQADGGSDHPWRFTPDKGGKYTFKAQEYMRGSGYGGGYEGDPDGAASETKLGAEATLTLFIGQRFTQKIGVSPDNATLVLWVWGDNVRATVFEVHGEVSPRVESDSPTARARAAMDSDDVQTALRALIDQSHTTIGGTLSTIVAEMVTKLNAHNAMGATTHNAADAVNIIPVELAASPSPQTLPEFVNDALLKMRRHRLNDHGGDPITPAPPGTGSANYHELAAVRKSDLLNMPLYQGVASLDEAIGALADIWRAHEGHRVSTAVHGTADSTNALTSLAPLLEVHRRFLAVLASLAPAVAPAQSGMGNVLVNSFGFEAS